ncbi:MAG: hypothetical protein IPM79_06940 [Polyangiaceae bacterium]|nr:hypothetical protein [Polyangiaceae bacterium]
MPSRRATTFAVAAASTACVLAHAPVAHAQDGDGPQWEKQIRIESDLRFRLEDAALGDVFTRRTLHQGVERNQNTLSTKLSVGWENLRAVAQADLVLYGYQDQINGLEGLNDVEQLQPYRIDINELYIQVKDLIVDGFDVRLGQQIVQWGVGDQFNPTNNLNADDLIDPLLFGKQQGNFMLRGDFWVTDDFSLQGVLVPLFKAARLPQSAQLQLLALDRLPILNDALRWRLAVEKSVALGALKTPTAVDQVTVVQPDPEFENMQAGFRMAGTLAEQDWSLSYFNGRTDFPVPLRNHTKQSDKAICTEKGNCSTGVLLIDTTLYFPKMHVYGLNLAGEFNPFKALDPNIGGIGYRLEGALVVPQEAKLTLSNDAISLGGFNIPEGEYDYDADGNPGGDAPLVVTDQPFLKWVLGLDYTFGSSGLYMNAMWVHGFVDEYGAGDWMFDGRSVRLGETVGDRADLASLAQCAIAQDGELCAREILRPRQGDFVIIGFDYKFLDDQALARLFTILEMSGYYESTVVDGVRVERALHWYTPEGFSASILPEFSYNFGNGLELGAGALLNIGKAYTKFGDPAAGGSLAFMKAKYTL